MMLVRTITALVLFGFFSLSALAEADPRPLLDFEQGSDAGAPRGWGGGPPGTLHADSLVAHSGQWSCRIERNTDSPSNFSTVTTSLDAIKQGKFITLRGRLKLEDVADYCGLWLRLDGEGGNVGFDNMARRQLKGTQDWAEYAIALPFSPETRKVVFGALMSGTGKLWVDDLELLVDGQPYAEAPDLVPEITILDQDTEFDAGSGFAPENLTGMQVRNLALLGKVWGFVKYHHPDVTSGTRHWDYDLFRALPGLMEAGDEKEAAGEIIGWLNLLAEPPPCDPCAELPESPEDLESAPRLDWLKDEQLLGRTLSQKLMPIYEHRHAEGPQFYRDAFPQVGNPKFPHEKVYVRDQLPDPGFRLLALFRYWNIIEYWFPNRDIIDRDWDEVLIDYIPRVVAAETFDDYQLTMLQLIAEVKDGHAQLYQADAIRPPVGEARLPFLARFIDGRAVVAYLSFEDNTELMGLRVGDVITKIDGAPVKDLIEEWAPYYPASNPDHRRHLMARNLARGPWGPVAVEVEREGKRLNLTLNRVGADSIDRSLGRTHDLPGDTFQLLGNEVGYLKLSSVELPRIASYLKQAEETQGLIIDIRNYPSAFVVFALGGRLIAESTAFVSFTVGCPANPGAFRWRETLSLSPLVPRYEGQVVILVDECSMSQAEYTAMALRVAPGAVVIGSTTAGADGNISKILLPGGLTTHISGIGVFSPDGSPTQRVGIVPDLEVRPTIAGLRENRDEVLEAGIRHILGESAENDLRPRYR